MGTICSPCVKFANRIGIRKKKETLWFVVILGVPHSPWGTSDGFSYKTTRWEKFSRSRTQPLRDVIWLDGYHSFLVFYFLPTPPPAILAGSPLSRNEPKSCCQDLEIRVVSSSQLPEQQTRVISARGAWFKTGITFDVTGEEASGFLMHLMSPRHQSSRRKRRELSVNTCTPQLELRKPSPYLQGLKTDRITHKLLKKSS